MLTLSTAAPPATFDRWTHPPYSGFNDGTFIWGRGASDDKTLLVGQYSALTLLLQDKNWVPRRTIILAHGFDEEEVHARQGAVEIGKWLEKKYGKDSILLAIDEGTSLLDGFGLEFAGPATSEKGYLDVQVRSSLVLEARAAVSDVRPLLSDHCRHDRWALFGPPSSLRYRNHERPCPRARGQPLPF